MVVVDISGISVEFPYDPYDVQIKYMAKVMDCLHYSCCGVLESPTGTGKTLSLLCACLAYLEDHKAKLKKQLNASAQASENGVEADHSLSSSMIHEPKVIYAMRTHSQVSHAFNELMRTGYKNIKATVIGSREQLCLNPDVISESNKNIKINLCRYKVNKGGCLFYNNVESTLAVTNNQKIAVDIEDLLQIGKKNQCCPYFLSRSLAREANVVFMPYNYLLDTKSRKRLDVNIEGNIVIFDEAHNVDQLCADSASTELRSADIAIAISEVSYLMMKIASLEGGATSASGRNNIDGFEDSDSNIDFSLSEVCCIKSLLCHLEDKLDSIEMNDDGGVTLSGPEIFATFEKAGVTLENRLVIIKVIEKLINYFSIGGKSHSMRKGGSLQKCVDMISMVFQTDKSNDLLLVKSSSSYKIHVTIDEGKKLNDVRSLAKQNKQPKVLHVWCFNPGVSMNQILAENPKCVIFTSGTLAPMESFISEMQIRVPVRLENPHIIQKSQLHAAVISKGPDGVALNSSYRTRSDEQYILSLGKTIVSFTRAIPRGVLVFFPSYYVMKECHKHWEEHGIWKMLSSLKKIFVETQGQDVTHLIEDYYEQNREPGGSGAIMMAVCRGKVSEGIDFADDNGRCVIITGLPFRPWKDPKVVGKIDYLNSQFSKKNVSIRGRGWYELDGTRAVNQAIGRVIRHKDDYATILLCDERFATSKVQSQLSSWIKPYLTVYDSFGFSLRDVVRFFRSKQDSSNTVAISSSALTTKSVKSTIQLEKCNSKDIVDLEAPTEEMNWAQTLCDYSGAAAKVQSTPTNLFSALESNSETRPIMSQTASTSRPLVTPDSLPTCEVKRKKLKVINPQETYEKAGTTSYLNGLKQNNPPTPEILLKNIKSLLTSDQYKIFSVAVKAYHIDHDIKKLSSTFSTICTNNVVRSALLAFHCLVPPTDRAQFKSSLLRINL